MLAFLHSLQRRLRGSQGGAGTQGTGGSFKFSQPPPWASPSPTCAGLQQPLGLEEPLDLSFFTPLSSMGAKLLPLPCRGCRPGLPLGGARDLSLLGVEDRPRQDVPQPRGPLCGPPAGPCQAFLPGWESGSCRGPGFRPGSDANIGLPDCLLLKHPVSWCPQGTVVRVSGGMFAFS